MALNTPVAEGFPLLGNAWAMFNNLPRFLCDQHAKHGPVFRIRALGREFVVLSGTDAVAFVGSAEGRDSLESKPSWIGMIAEYGSDKSLVSDDGDMHAQFREMMRRGYSPQSLDGRYARIVRVIDDWIDRYLTSGSVIHAVPKLQELIIDEISIAIADQILFENIDHIRTQVHWSTNVHLLKRWPAAVLKLPKYQRAKARLMADANRITEIFMERSNHASAHGSGARLFDDLIEAHKQRPDLMTDYELPLNLFGPFLAGMDTASNTVAAVLYTIVANTECWDQVRGEADDLFSTDEPITSEALFQQGKYLNATVKETMRLFPSVPALMRHARRDFEFLGHAISQGDQVMIGTCVPQMSETYFKDPLRFDPSRFMGDDRTHLRPGVYSPFGRGHHMCIGKRIAEVLVPLTVARIVHRKNYHLADPRASLGGRYGYGVDLALNIDIRAGTTRNPATSGFNASPTRMVNS